MHGDHVRRESLLAGGGREGRRCALLGDAGHRQKAGSTTNHSEDVAQSHRNSIRLAGSREYGPTEPFDYSTTLASIVSTCSPGLTRGPRVFSSWMAGQVGP